MRPGEAGKLSDNAHSWQKVRAADLDGAPVLWPIARARVCAL